MGPTDIITTTFTRHEPGARAARRTPLAAWGIFLQQLGYGGNSELFGDPLHVDERLRAKSGTLCSDLDVDDLGIATKFVSRRDSDG